MFIDTPNLTDLRLLLNKKEADQNIICSLTDRKGNILYVNERFCEISGYDESELIGANHNIINSGLHDRNFFKHMWHTVGNGHIWQGEIRNKSKSGICYWVDTIIFPVYSPELKEKQYFSVRTLVDDKKKVEAERQRRLDELQTILFKISHELRQPVTQLMGIWDVVSDSGNISPAVRQEMIEYIGPSIQLLDNYTRELSYYIQHISEGE